MNKQNIDLDKLIDEFEERIKFHRKSIEHFKTFGNMLQKDISISEGQIMEDSVIIEILFNLK